jgi:hypothetical protein
MRKKIEHRDRVGFVEIQLDATVYGERQTWVSATRQKASGLNIIRATFMAGTLWEERFTEEDIDEKTKFAEQKVLDAIEERFGGKAAKPGPLDKKLAKLGFS